MPTRLDVFFWTGDGFVVASGALIDALYLVDGRKVKKISAGGMVTKDGNVIPQWRDTPPLRVSVGRCFRLEVNARRESLRAIAEDLEAAARNVRETAASMG